MVAGLQWGNTMSDENQTAWRRLPWVVAVAVIGVSVFLMLIAGGATAQSEGDTPETAGEFLDAFLELQGSDALGEYTEFETIRSVGVAETQVGTFTETDRQRMDAVYRSISAFDRAYRQTSTGNYSRGLDAAEESAAAIEDLKSQDAKYAPLAELALNRFLRDRAEELLSKAEDADKTADQVRNLSLSARAYELAGATQKYTEVSNREQEQRTELQQDVEVINDTIADADAFIAGCSGCAAPGEAITAFGPGVFTKYRTAFGLDARLGSSKTEAEQHGLDQKIAQIETQNEDVGRAQRTLAAASGALIAAFLLVIAPLTAVLTLRVTAWHQDATRAGIGKSVLAEEVADA